MSDASVYPEPNNTFKQSKRNVLSIIVDNEPGILARIVGLFSGRGYNIEALNVTVVDIKENLSRITLADLNESYEAEISLIKIIYENEDQNLKTLALADIYRTRTVTKKDGIVIYEISGTSERVNKFLDDLNGINGIKVEIVRSGPIGLGV